MAKTTEKANNLFLNWTPEAMLHENAKKDGTGSVINVSIHVAQSKTGLGSFAVNPKQVLAQTKRDGSEAAGYKAIVLGQPTGKRQVSICTKAGKKPVYSTIEMTNEEIVASVAAARKEYREAQKALATE